MPRAAMSVLVAVTLAAAILFTILHVNASEAEPASSSDDPRAAPAFLSTVELTTERAVGPQLLLTLERGPDVTDRALTAESLADEPVPVSYKRVSDAEEGTLWSAPAWGPASYSVTVQVPDVGAIEPRILSCEVVSPDGTPVALPDGFDPNLFVDVSAPAIMRDLRVVSVTFTPIRAWGQGHLLARSVSLSVDATGGAGVNERVGRDVPLSPAFDRLYRSTVLNYDCGMSRNEVSEAFASAYGLDGTWSEPDAAADRGSRYPGARYLVIAADSMSAAIEPLIEWKELKGVPTEYVTLETIGWTTTAIQTYVQNAYDTWDMPPEFLLLVGDTEVLPAFGDTLASDNYYGTVAGGDLFADIMIGRFSVDLVSQCEVMVAKTLFYERTPYEDDPNWPASASLCQRDDPDGNWIYYDNTWYLYDLFTDAGFAPVDTLFSKYGLGYEDVKPLWDAGRGFLHYRGQAMMYWVMPFSLGCTHEYGIDNGWRQSIAVSPTCGTGRYGDDDYMCEDWTRGGTTEEPRGSVAVFATGTAFESAEFLALTRSSISYGFFGNAFGPDALTIGESCLAGKLNMYQTFQDTLEYESWQLLGDPELNMWTGVPAHTSVLHDPTVLVGQADMTVTVLRGGLPVENALVSFFKEGDVQSWGYTGAAGNVTLPVAAATAGALHLTVTARNCYPYESDVLVLDSGPYLICSDVVYDDLTGGNGDGLLSPGETSVIEVGLENVGDITAYVVSAVFRTSDAHVTVTDSTASYAHIAPDAIAWPTDGFEISVAPGCPRGHLIPYTLEVNYSGDTGTRVPVPLEAVTGELSYAGITVHDAPPGGNGNGIADAGETVALELSLLNGGLCDLGEIGGAISTDDAFTAVTWATGPFGDAPAGETCANAVDALILSISPAAPDGHVAPFELALTATGHSYGYADTLAFDLPLANGSYVGVTGPDAYGYYAYDTADTIYDAAPTYDWYDIAPPGPGVLITAITDEDAAITTQGTMFSIGYYGEGYSEVSINSNGFLAMDWEDYRFGDNSGIPDSHGPARMIAPFWDDLDPSAGGDIYRWLDFANNRLIFQYDEVPIYGTTQTQTFQVIFYNENSHPTPTGDSKIVFQYETVSFPYSCTVGIENAIEDDGIQWLYNASYAPQAMPLSAGMAILFTTEPPDLPNVPWLVLDDVTIDDTAVGNGDGLAQPGETVELLLDVRNDGGRDALGGSVVLSSQEGVVSLGDSTSAMSDVLASGTGQNADALSCTFSEAIDDTVATVWAAFSANGGVYATTARLDLHIDLSGTGVDDPIPVAFRLHPMSPNPFAQGSTVRLALPAPERVTVRVYDPSGRLVRTLVDAPLPAGEHRLDWDGRDASGRRVASGVYFVRAEAGRQSGSRKVVLLR
jgi:hypothetical protein